MFFRTPRPKRLAKELVHAATKINDVEIGKLILRSAEKIGELGYAYKQLAKILSAIVILKGGRLIVPDKIIQSVGNFEELEITDPDEKGNVFITLRGAGILR